MSWITEWQNDEYMAQKQEELWAVEQYLAARDIRTVLEIGPGLAWESRQWQAKWHTVNHLIERDGAGQGTRHKDFGDAGTMTGYHTLAQLRGELARWPEFQYRLWDTDQLPEQAGVTYDLVYSNRSWGFHYPVTTHRDWIMRHSHDRTVIIAQLRNRVAHPGVRVIERIHRAHKCDICHIEYL